MNSPRRAGLCVSIFEIASTKKKNVPMSEISSGRCVMKRRRRRRLHRLFHCRPLCAANSFHFLHPLLHGRFCEKCPLLELFQNARPFILLLKSTDGTIDRFILSNDNSDQSNHLLRAAVSGRLNLRRDTLNNFGFSRLW